jgi:hypothetical protein
MSYIASSSNLEARYTPPLYRYVAVVSEFIFDNTQNLCQETRSEFSTTPIKVRIITVVRFAGGKGMIRSAML